MFSLITMTISMQLANASTYYMSDVGIRAMGRGGAFIAGADDISAQWYNPSALTRISGMHLQFDVAAVKQQIYFDRLDYPGEGQVIDGNSTDLVTDPITNEALPLPIPHFAFIHDFGIKDLTVLIGFTTPYATGLKFPTGGAQRYSLEDSVVIHTYTGPAVAYQVTPRLSLGFGTSWNYMVVGQSLQVSLQIPNSVCDGQTENPECDIGFDVLTKDPAMFTWNAAATIESLDKRFAGAFMFQPKISVDATGTLAGDFRNNFFHEQGLIKSEVVRDDFVTLNIELPMILKGGVLFRPRYDFEIELAGTFEQWSVLQTLDIQNVDMKIELTELIGDTEITDDISLPTNFKDSFSVRLGWDWDLSKIWNVRQGFLYESTGLKLQYMNPSLIDRQKFGLGLGASWSPNPKWTIDSALFGALMGTWETINSKSKQIAVLVDPFNGAPEASVVTGRDISDGSYRSSNWIGGVSITHHFGQTAKW